jgi:2-polyprenyl-3-methyl-5-hydroxy-6-metoxy-1,4-benzoquinol methylase
VETTWRRCPLCQGTGGGGRFEAVDHREGLGGRFTIVECEQCGLVRTEPVPADLSAYYPSTYQQHNANGLTARVVSRAITHVAAGRGTAATRALVARLIPDADLGGALAPNARVLDVGAGNGNAVRALTAAGVEAHGIEPDEGGVAAAREAGCSTLQCGTLEESELRRQRWEVIRLFHVLEHVHDPVATLRVAGEALASDGRLVVAVPNVGGVPSRAFGRSWDGLEVPRHLVHFNRASLGRALESAGLTVVSIKTTPLFGVLPGSVDAWINRGRRQSGWGNSLAARVFAYPLELLCAALNAGDGLIAVARPRR